jgi:competence protein ComEC
LAAQLTILPIILFHFEQVSLITLVANPLILPLQPFVMILGGIAVIAGMIIAPLGQLLSYLVWVPLYYTNQVVTWLAGFSEGIFVVGEFSWISVLVLYGLILFFTQKSKETRLPDLHKPVFLLGSFITAIFLIWNSVMLQPDQNLHLWVMDGGNQGAVFVQTPSGKTILINAGELANPLSSELNKHIPALHRSIDLAIVTGSNQKTYQAFSKILERFSINQFLWSDKIPATRIADSIMKSIKDREILVETLKEGEVIDCGDGVSLEKKNVQETGVSLILRYKEFRFVFLEEVFSDDEAQTLDGSVVLANPYLKNDLNEILWTPQILIHHEIMEDELPGQISTDNSGMIEITTNGEQMWLNGEK